MVILVVEDQPAAGEALSRLLEIMGHEVHLAATSARAFAILQTVRPDLAVVDIGLPDASGYDVARRIRSLLEPAPVLVGLSAWDPDPVADAVFDHRLVKPLAMEELERFLWRCSL